MSAQVTPPAEYALALGVRRAVSMLRLGATVEQAEGILTIAGYAAMLLDSEREDLDP